MLVKDPKNPLVNSLTACPVAPVLFNKYKLLINLPPATSVTPSETPFNIEFLINSLAVTSGLFTKSSLYLPPAADKPNKARPVLAGARAAKSVEGADSAALIPAKLAALIYSFLCIKF